MDHMSVINQNICILERLEGIPSDKRDNYFKFRNRTCLQRVAFKAAFDGLVNFLKGHKGTNFPQGQSMRKASLTLH